MKLNVI